ncbi:MAG: hypothetical protein AAFN77_20395, partial [Planctomycetota bacterium]
MHNALVILALLIPLELMFEYRWVVDIENKKVHFCMLALLCSLAFFCTLLCAWRESFVGKRLLTGRFDF